MASEIANNLITNEINSDQWIVRGFIDDYFLKRNKSNKKNILNKIYKIYKISEVENKKTLICDCKHNKHKKKKSLYLMK